MLQLFSNFRKQKQNHYKLFFEHNFKNKIKEKTILTYQRGTLFYLKKQEKTIRHDVLQRNLHRERND